MPSFLTTNDVYVITGSARNLFDTFKRPITVHKEPTQTVVSSAVPMYGYGQPSVSSSVSYTPVTGIFDARIFYPSSQMDKTLKELKMSIPDGGAVIKVLSDGKDYLLDGKIEKVEADGKFFNIDLDYSVSNFKGFITYNFACRSLV
jgi:hypothetical protein